MNKQTQAIQQSARVAELRSAANEIAAMSRPAPVVALPGTHRGDRRRLLALLVHERRRSAALLAELLR